MDTEDTDEFEREAFRVNDLGVIYYRPATEQDMENPLAADVFGQDPNIHLEQLRMADQRSYALLQQIAAKNESLGKYLTVMQTKVNILTDICMHKNQVKSKKQKINLSASGAGFGTEVIFPKGSHLCIRITLEPDMNIIHAIGCVVRSQEKDKEEEFDDNFQYWTAIHFINITDLEQQWLMRHLMQVQARDIRKRREQEEDKA